MKMTFGKFMVVTLVAIALVGLCNYAAVGQDATLTIMDQIEDLNLVREYNRLEKDMLYGLDYQFIGDLNYDVEGPYFSENYVTYTILDYRTDKFVECAVDLNYAQMRVWYQHKG